MTFSQNYLIHLGYGSKKLTNHIPILSLVFRIQNLNLGQCGQNWQKGRYTDIHDKRG